MTETFFRNDPAGVFDFIPLPDFRLTWAGANPFGEGFCFGSESGELGLTDTRGRRRFRLPSASASNEAISGVAYSQNWLAVTTRKDINFIEPMKRDTRNGE